MEEETIIAVMETKRDSFGNLEIIPIKKYSENVTNSGNPILKEE